MHLSVALPKLHLTSFCPPLVGDRYRALVVMSEERMGPQKLPRLEDIQTILLHAVNPTEG